MPTLADKIRLLVQWSPVINFLLAISNAPPGKERVYRALDLLDYVAAQTPTGLDNDLLSRMRAVLLTPQGGELIDYLATLLNGVFNDPGPLRLHDPKV